MIILNVYPSSLRITSHKTALQFFDCIKTPILIDYEPGLKLRIEPGNLIGVVSRDDIRNGTAWFVPNFHDDDGSIAYHYRKYINAYLRGD